MNGRILAESDDGFNNWIENEKPKKENSDEMRTFQSGATRGSEEDKLDFEGFLSPLVIYRYAQYMHKHREQADGKMRASDNWQKGIPIEAYMKSKFRHFMNVWLLHRTTEITPLTSDDIEEALCADLFNTMGMLHEYLVAAWKSAEDDQATLIRKEEK